MGATKPTGAIIDGNCPGCGRRMAGMMPERCFFCGYDFTESIRAQNEHFEPTEEYKSMAADATPSVEDVESALGGDGGDFDRYAGMTAALNEQMDTQRDIEKEAKKIVNRIILAVAMRSGGINELQSAIKHAIPEIDNINCETYSYFDTEDGQNKVRVKVDFDLLSAKIVDIHIERVIAESEMHE